MPGTFIPPWFIRNVPTCNDLATISIIWGLTLGLSLFGFIRVCKQTYHQWKRARRVTMYMALIWTELIGSFEFFFGLRMNPGTSHTDAMLTSGAVVLWVFQIHCIMQIIINRIALLAVSPSTICRIRWGTVVILALINISVFCIWIPSRLQISPTYKHINNIWDRIEKALFAIIDVSLNLYFIYLVRSSLISYGLRKYVVLYRFNLAMIFVSATMDVLIIGMMSLTNPFLYVLFHPLAYLVKLHIELWMAELIAKIVKASTQRHLCHCACHNTHSSSDCGTRPRSPQSPDKLAPTLGRLRRSLPVWPGHRARDGRQRQSILGSTQPEPRLKRLARTEVSLLRRMSWCRRSVNRELDVEMANQSGSAGLSSKNSDHQE